MILKFPFTVHISNIDSPKAHYAIYSIFYAIKIDGFITRLNMHSDS